MKTNLENRVKNFEFPNDTPILACIDEAVSNSIQSIYNSSNSEGQININMELVGNTDAEGREEFNVLSILIEDNGQGFTKANFNSFCELDTTNKDKEIYACRGVGRLLLLKVFNTINIESTHHENEVLFQRNFPFSLSWGTIEDLPNYSPFQAQPAADSSIISTKIKLENITSKYQNEKFDAHYIKNHLISHFMPLFIKGKDKNITFQISINKTGNKSTDENISFTSKEVLEQHVNHKDEFMLKDADKQDYTVRVFHIKHTEKPKNKENNNRIHFCAGYRVVKEEKVENFTSYSFSENGKETYYSAYIVSDRLDESVQSSRSDWQKDANTKKILEDIKQEAAKKIAKYLAPITEKLEAKKNDEIFKVFAEHPVYAYLTSDLKKATSLDDDKESIEKTMYAQHISKKVENRKALEKQLKGKKIIEDFSKFYQDNIMPIKEASMVDLTEYFSYRKYVIELLDKLINKAKDSKQSYERILHELFYPQRKGTNLPFDAHNLWFLDERYVPFQAVYSDEKMSKILGDKFQGQNSGNELYDKKEPDLLIFYTPLGNNEKYNIVSIELKGVQIPTSEKLKAIEQIYERTESFRTLENINQIWYYMIAEFDEEFENKLRGVYGYTKLFTTETGIYYRYWPESKSHTYAVSYAALLEDSKARHKLFFDLLGNNDNLPIPPK